MAGLEKERTRDIRLVLNGEARGWVGTAANATTPRIAVNFEP